MVTAVSYTHLDVYKRQAFAEDGNIYIEPLNRKVLDGISI